ncbi:RNA polymerase sigma factor YlaC [Botrimarina colliarenosi]|uniref:RNA polymerase sigma factor YlaC n=1 Tax=Botrimarina colliarenosi TaxID=2528001 RepID=A0A5C6AHU4_9BACT|nr:sigma-70 family RNA polymerase sigma factor [Botrimarina colliarenosi]TWT99612.1 RNA polymerase sigma factor YlaC [Botrimarina colliarenosi]
MPDPTPTRLTPLGDGLPDPLPKPLVVRARSDREAFGELYDRTHGAIYRYCRRRIGERAAAEDACSAVFLAIAEQMPSFSGDSEVDFRRWAFAIARKQTASLLRGTGRRARLLAAAAEGGVVGAAPADEAETEGDALRAALAHLGEREQTLIDLRYTEGMTHQEIARVLGLRSGAVRTAISRAIAKLRQDLTPSHSATR